MRALALTAILAAFVSTSALAQSESESAEAKKEKKICQTEKMTGSLTRVRRICLTQAEWNDLRLKTKHSFEEKVNGAAGGLETRPQPGAG